VKVPPYFLTETNQGKTMTHKHTILNLATDYRLWGKYVDSAALDTEEAFNKMTVEEKVKTCIDCFLTGDEHLDAQRPIIVEVPHQRPATVQQTDFDTYSEVIEMLADEMPDGECSPPNGADREQYILDAHGHDLSGFAVYDNLADAIAGEAMRTHQGDTVRYKLHLLCGDEVTA
jgi:hypothetical protein